MSFNPYVDHICEMTGDSPRVVRRELRPLVLTDAQAQERGYSTALEYQEALHEFLNGN